MLFTVWQSLLQALENLRDRPSRSLITSLGITVSVASVIAVVSIIQGLSQSVLRNFEGLGTNVLTVQAQTSFQDQMLGKANRLVLSDYLLVKRQLNGQAHVIPFFSPFGPFGTEVSSQDQVTQTRVLAATSAYKDVVKLYPDRGRFITDGDNRYAARVCVIGERVRKNLKLPKDPIGAYISVGGSALKVVGVMEERGSILGISQDDYLVVPFSVGQRLMPDESLQNIVVLADIGDVSRMKPLQKRLERALRDAHRLGKGAEDDFRVQSAQQLTASISNITNTVTLVLAGVVGISLIVGGIGIMNIMLVSITERTREIGICKALGAQRHEILMQFLFEALILSLIGCVIGIVAGWLSGQIAVLFIPGLPPPVIPGWAIGLALGFSSAVGLIFGVIPAAKAADLDPIVALHYE